MTAATRILYHYNASTFSRRARLALAHKEIDVELRDPRADAAVVGAAERLTPIRTLPVLVDEGRVIADSGAIAMYLDLAYPDKPRLWPLEPRATSEALGITTNIDVAMNALVDLATRLWDLRNDPAWESVAAERMSRAHLAIHAVAERASASKHSFLVGNAWSVADIWTLAATLWITAMPARASSSPNVARILTLGFRLPDALVTWAKQHEGRAEVKAIYGE